MSTEAKHTPGPFQAARINSAAFNIRAGEDSVALVYANLGSPTLNDRDGEGEANANLFAAALATHPVLEHLIATSDHPSIAAIFEPMRRAALAKAEGRDV